MANKVKPIKVSEIDNRKNEAIPDVVFEVFNELIAKNYSEGSSRIYQKDAVKLMVEKGLDEDDIFDNHWLDVEGIYRKAGWKVEYDKPGYCETYDAYFVFSKRSRTYDD